MNPRFRLSRRARLLRLVAGAALIAVGCVVFQFSKSHDPDNRAALLAIIAVVVGISWTGQGLRGRRDGAVYTGEPAAKPGAEPIPLETSVVGLLLGWAVPGAGHWIIGRRGKALLFFGTITITFLIGAALGQGRTFPYEANKVYYLAYMFNAGETGIAWLLANDLELDKPIRFLQLGFLYCAVASLLNVVALMDFLATCLRRPALAEAPAPPAAEEAGAP